MSPDPNSRRPEVPPTRAKVGPPPVAARGGTSVPRPAAAKPPTQRPAPVAVASTAPTSADPAPKHRPRPRSAMGSRGRLLRVVACLAVLLFAAAVTTEIVSRWRRATPVDDARTPDASAVTAPTTTRSPGVIIRRHTPHDPRILFEPIAALSYEERCMGNDDKEFVGLLSPDTWLKYEAVDFGPAPGANWFSATIAVTDAFAGRIIEVRLDGPRGPIISALRVESTGGWFEFAAQVAPMTPTSGVRDVYLTFSGGNSVGNLRSFKFARTPRAAVGVDIPARQYDAMSGIRDHTDKIGQCDTGHWVRYGGLDLRDAEGGINSISIDLACPEDYAGKVIEIRFDSLSAAPAGELTVESTGGWGKSETQSTPLKPTTGIHDVYFTFRGGAAVGDIYSIRFDRK